ncbi:ArsA family ATPase [Aeromicrobium sp. CTD01-1L150]|uniref:ArsA family ATPase n=1 Tax=Aeromicrobium sp. CTD01-1L150 TaxID=3341830 RepID=UPI0035C13C31
MLLTLTAERRVLFVGGKGGVGKTSIASAAALARARDGARVLLVSTDPAHNLGHLWLRQLGDSTTRVLDDRGVVDALEIDPETTVDRHLQAVWSTMSDLLPERMHPAARRHLELARTSPGTHESAVLDRVAECVEVGLESYDLIVFDTAPTGHTVRLLALPDQLTSWSDGLLANRDRAERFGAAVRGLGGRDPHTDRDAALRRVLVRRRRRFALLRDTIADVNRSSFVVVLTAERLPVLESVALCESLDELGVHVGALVVNRRSPTDAGPLLAERHRREGEQVELLRSSVPDVALQEVPLLAEEVAGESGIAHLAAAIAR